ncbi:MAG: NAD(P)/FAD-dependent oxidoreductase [Pseudomonadota bacterium]
MKKEYQAIIVGSGPAGAASAKALKNEGIEVLVIEKDALPRNKVCSGLLFDETQVLLDKYFGVLPPEDDYCNPKILKRENILEWNKEKGFFSYPFDLPKDGQPFSSDEVYNIWRSKFDYWLLKESGVEYIDNCKLNNYSMENGKIKVEVSINDEKNDLYCSYLIGADGAGSRVRALVDPSFLKIEMASAVYQAYYRFSDMGTLEDDHFYVFFEKQIAEAITCVHRKDDFLALCVCGFKGRSLKESMEVFKDLLAENFQVVLKDMYRDEGCLIRLVPLYLGKDNIILTGEAARIVYLNGEGISAAIDSGYRAGISVAQGIKKGSNVLEIYEKDLEGVIRHMKLCKKNMHFLA